MRRYFDLHLQNLLGACGRLARQPFATLLTVLVIAIAMALPAGLRVLVNNAGALSAEWQSAADFTVYFKTRRADRQSARGRAPARGARRRGEHPVHRPRLGARGVSRALGIRRCARGPRRQSATGRRRRAARERRLGRRRVPCGRDRRAARDGPRAARHAVGRAAASDARARWADRRSRDRLARACGCDRRRQHDPAGNQQPEHGDRGHQARRRDGRVRPPAVPLSRPLLRARGRRARRAARARDARADRITRSASSRRCMAATSPSRACRSAKPSRFSAAEPCSVGQARASRPHATFARSSRSSPKPPRADLGARTRPVSDRPRGPRRSRLGASRRRHLRAVAGLQTHSRGNGTVA